MGENLMKYLFVIILISSLIFCSGCINNPAANITSSSKTFHANGTVFKYPASWSVNNKTGKYIIARIVDPKAKSNDKKPGAVIEISKKESSGIPLERYYDEVKSGASSVAGYQLISERNYKVDNVTAYEFTSRAKDKNIEEEYRVVLLEKKGYIYMIACGTRSPTHMADKSNDFDTVINSFRITY